MDIFMSQAGNVKVIEVEHAVEGTLSIVGMSGRDKDGRQFQGKDGITSKVILTNFNIKQAVGAQFMQTLGDELYVYNFGDQMGSCVITGMSFLRRCDEDSSITGIDEILSYYTKSKLSSQIAADPDTGRVYPGRNVLISLGAHTLTGYLTGIDMAMAGTDYYFARFTLTLRVSPRMAVLSGGGAGGAPIGGAAAGPLELTPVRDEEVVAV